MWAHFIGLIAVCAITSLLAVWFASSYVNQSVAELGCVKSAMTLYRIDGHNLCARPDGTLIVPSIVTDIGR